MRSVIGGGTRARFFLAVPVDGYPARRLAREAAAICGKGARRSHVADLHVTLCFFGDKRTLALLRALKAIDVRSMPRQFAFRVARIAPFAPTSGRHLVALPDRHSARRLAALHASLPARIRRLEPRADARRRYLPHVTLARIRPRDHRPGTVPARHRLRADRVALYRSTGRAAGPRYDVVRTWRLRPR